MDTTVGTFIYDAFFFVGSESILNRPYVSSSLVREEVVHSIIAEITGLKPLTQERYQRKDRGP